MISTSSISKIKERVLNAIDESTTDLIRLTEEFVNVPTVNPPGEHYVEMAELIAKRLEELGFAVELVNVPESKLREFGLQLPRVNVIGRLEGVGGGPTLVFNGHYDVVPAGTGWVSDPFKAIVREGKIYGRGTSDMKAAFAAMMIAVKAIKKVGLRLKGDLVFTATPDEETGGHTGAEYIVKNGLVRGNACIIGEPTEPDKVCVAHKGVLWLEVTTYGRSAHASMPHLGINAVEKMAKVIISFEKLKTTLSKRKTKAPMPEEVRSPTIMVGGVIQGGVKINVVPDKCTVTIDRRLIPEENFDQAEKEILDLLNDLMREDPELRIEVRVLERAAPAYTPVEEKIVQVLTQSIRNVYGREPIISGLAGFTDMRFFNQLMPSVLYGPGSMTQAHVANEFVAINDLINAAKVYALTLMSYLGVQE